MINRIYRLVDTKQIEMKQREVIIDENTVLVKPEYMSICAADQRYYLGQRKKEVLDEKLPMALIHEATGSVVKDFTGKFKSGAKVVLIPLEEGADDSIKGNYRPDSKFASSGIDGFMRDIISIDAERLVLIDDDYTNVYVFAEILSVALNAIKSFELVNTSDVDSIGIWGDGSMGFITALALRCKYPEAKLYVFGKSIRKLSKFSFVTAKHYIDNIPSDIYINHAFECVGGKKSESAIKQAIDIIKPQGVINLLGVSEDAIRIDTRRVLDKGLKFVGSSRSDKSDFEDAVEMLKNDTVFRKYISILISETIEVKNDEDISFAFEQDILNDFKTIIKWLL